MTADIIDIIIVVLILLSTIVGLVMGFVKEFLILSALIVAFTLGVIYREALAPELPFTLGKPMIQEATAFAIIFLSSLLIGLIISSLLSNAIERIGLGTFDHVLGAVFGLALGGMVITSVVLMFQTGSFAKQAEWQDSQLIPYFEKSAAWTKEAIPDDWNQQVNDFFS